MNITFQCWDNIAFGPEKRWEDKAEKICEDAFHLFIKERQSAKASQENIQLLGNKLEEWMQWPLWKADLCAQEIARRWEKAMSAQYQGEEAINQEMALRVVVQSTLNALRVFR